MHLGWTPPEKLCRSQNTNQSGEQNKRLTDLCFVMGGVSQEVFISRPQPNAQSLFLVWPCAFFLCFSSPARVAFGWNLKKKGQIVVSNNSDDPCHLSYFFFSSSLTSEASFFLTFILYYDPSSPKKNRKRQKKTEDHKIRAVDCRCHAPNTCTLHLQTRLSGRRNFFTVIEGTKKNFLLLRNWRW